MSNKYHDELTANGARPTAEVLLTILRKEVQPVLEEYGVTSPPSDSTRAVMAMAVVNNQISSLRAQMGGTGAFMDATRVAREHVRLLQRFIAVHETVWILEGRALH